MNAPERANPTFCSLCHILFREHREVASQRRGCFLYVLLGKLRYLCYPRVVQLQKNLLLLERWSESNPSPGREVAVANADSSISVTGSIYDISLLRSRNVDIAMPISMVHNLLGFKGNFASFTCISFLRLEKASETGRQLDVPLLFGFTLRSAPASFGTLSW